MLVKWKPVPEQYCNGIILGYRLSWKFMSAVDHQQEPNGEETEKWPRKATVLGPNVFLFLLRDVKAFRWYCLKMLAFTRKGDGVESSCIFILTDEDGKMQYQQYGSCKAGPFSKTFLLFPMVIRLLYISKLGTPWYSGLSDSRSEDLSPCGSTLGRSLYRRVFFFQEIIVHIVCLHPGVEISTMTNCYAAPAVVYYQNGKGFIRRNGKLM